MTIIITKNYEEMSDRTVDIIKTLIGNRPNAKLGLTTGATPKKTYQKLINMHLDWSKITTFNLGEYMGIKPIHKISCRHFMDKELFNHINIEPTSTFIPDGHGPDSALIGKEYEEEIEKQGGIDLQLLTIGENGYIGFNEPGSEEASVTSPMDLSNANIQLNARSFDSIHKVPKKALAMGINTILNTKKILLIASGLKKSAAIKQMVEGPATVKCPASFLQKHDDVTLILDNDAASLLNKEGL